MWFLFLTVALMLLVSLDDLLIFLENCVFESRSWDLIGNYLSTTLWAKIKKCCFSFGENRETYCANFRTKTTFGNTLAIIIQQIIATSGWILNSTLLLQHITKDKMRGNSELNEPLEWNKVKHVRCLLSSCVTLSNSTAYLG